MATVRRADITLSEEQTPTYSGAEISWVATFDGRVIPTKETVVMYRSAPHAGEALLKLEEALAANGWEVR